MATQKRVEEFLKTWQEATAIQEAVKAAKDCVTELNGLYDESATNLLKRKPELMLLLSAYKAGQDSIAHSASSASGESPSLLQ